MFEAVLGLHKGTPACLIVDPALKRFVETNLIQLQRSVLHKATLLVSFLPPQNDGSQQQAAHPSLCTALPVSAKSAKNSVPLPDPQMSLSPKPSTFGTKDKVKLNPPQRRYSGAPPFLENPPSPAPLVFTPVPPEMLAG